MESYKSFHERLQEVAYEKKINQTDIAGALGKKKPTVNKWWHGGIVPDMKNMKNIADYLGCNFAYLAIGKGPKYPDEQIVSASDNSYSQGPPILKKIPVISWVQAGDWVETDDPFQPGYAEEWINNTATNHPNAFALVVHGDSMEPEFREGEIITIDPGREAINGSYIIAKNGDEATFKQLVIDGSSVFLKPLNPRYPIRDMTGIEFRVIGVVVFKGKGY